MPKALTGARGCVKLKAFESTGAEKVNLHDYDPRSIRAALERGGIADLRRACQISERIADAAILLRDCKKLIKGTKLFRARADYSETTGENGNITGHSPLSGDDMGAPPASKVSLGRFNAPQHPVLYLATTPEVALTESRALSDDECSVAEFQLKKDIHVGLLLRHKKWHLSALLDEKPSDEDLQKWLLARTADFVSRRVSDRDRDLHYRACNLISAAFRDKGLHGLIYRTSFWSPGWEEPGQSDLSNGVLSANVVLFSPDDAECIKSVLCRIDWRRPIAQLVGGPVWHTPPINNGDEKG